MFVNFVGHPYNINEFVSTITLESSKKKFIFVMNYDFINHENQ